MGTGSVVYILFLIIIFCFVIYDSIPSKYTKLEESFGGFMNRSLVRFDYEKSPLHTIVYGGTGTGKTYFIRQNLKLYSVQNQDQNQAKNIVIVCKDDRDWIDPESNKFYTGFNKCDINKITKNMHKFQNCVIALDDMGDRSNKDLAYYFTEGKNYNIQMIVMCQKPAQIIITARMSCDTIYLTTYNGPDLLKNFNEIYKCEHDFSKIISELNSNHYNRTDGMSDELRYGIIKYHKKENTIIINRNRTMIYDSRVGFLDLKALSLKDELEREDINKLIAYMKSLMINATDRNTINHDNYQFYFHKLLTLNNIKIQNDVLTKEMVKAKGLKQLSNIGGIIGCGLVITSYNNPDSIIKTVGAVTMSASNMLNRANTLVNVGYGEDLPSRYPDSETWAKPYPRSGYTDGEPWTKSYLGTSYTDLKNSLVNGARKLVTTLEKLQEYINEVMGILNRKGGKLLTRLFGNNEEFREEIIKFVRDKKELDLELILDKRCKTNTLNTLGNRYLAECITSKDNTKDLIEIMVKYYLQSSLENHE